MNVMSIHLPRGRRRKGGGGEGVGSVPVGTVTIESPIIITVSLIMSS